MVFQRELTAVETRVTRNAAFDTQTRSSGKDVCVSACGPRCRSIPTCLERIAYLASLCRSAARCCYMPSGMVQATILQSVKRTCLRLAGKAICMQARPSVEDVVLILRPAQESCSRSVQLLSNIKADPEDEARRKRPTSFTSSLPINFNPSVHEAVQ